MSSGSEPMDDLADMFVTTPDRTGGPAKGDATAVVHMLLVGHLPVRAGLWLAPFADALAREHGPTALVRLDREHPSIQVLRGGETMQRPASEATFREAVGELGAAATRWVVQGKLNEQHPTEDLVDEVVTARPDHITILSSADPAAVVAAYELVKRLAQVISAGSQDEPDAPSRPRIGLAVLGANHEDAKRVFERIDRTTTTFLDVQLDHVLTLPRMDADVRSTCYLSFTDEPCPTLQQVAAWVKQSSREAVAAAVDQDSSSAHAAASDVAIEPEHLGAGEAESIANRPDPEHDEGVTTEEQDALINAASEDSAEVEEALASDSELTEAEVVDVNAPARREGDVIAAPVGPSTSPTHAATELMASERRTESSSSSTVDAPSQDPLDAPTPAPIPTPTPTTPTAGATRTRSEPEQPRPLIEVLHGKSSVGESSGQTKTGSQSSAVNTIGFEPKPSESVREPDQDGKPVPFAAHVDGIEPLPPRCPGHERVELAVDTTGRLHLLCDAHGMRELHFVQSWAHAHREILAMACPSLPAQQPRGPVCHVIANEPRQVSDLHGSDLKLHVLAPVDVDGKRGWFAAPLN